MAKPPTKKPAASKTAPKDEYTDSAQDEQEVVLILGKIGAGKTFTAASASKFRKKPAGKEAKMTDLEDMFWGEADSKACAGFKHNNMKVRRYNFVAEMNRTGKSITFVIQKFLDRVVELWHPDLKVVIDSLTGLDTLMFRTNFKKYRDHPNSYEVYKQNLGDHMMLSQDLKMLNTHLIYCCHGRRFKDDDDKSLAVRMAGGGEMMPDITGQAPKFYKRDATIQMGVLARKKPKSKEVTRTVVMGVEADGEGIEGKNRYEGLIPDRMSPPHLAKIFQMIKGGKR